MLEQLSRREIRFPPAGTKRNELIVRYVHVAYEKVCSRLYLYYVILVTTYGQ